MCSHRGGNRERSSLRTNADRSGTSSAHELATRESVTLDECGAFRLMYQGDSASMQPFFGNEVEAFKSAHNPVAISNTLAVLKRLLLRGVGIAFYTRLGFAEELASGRLVAVPIKGERLSTLRLCLIAPSDRMPTVATCAVAEHLQRALPQFARRPRAGALAMTRILRSHSVDERARLCPDRGRVDRGGRQVPGRVGGAAGEIWKRSSLR